MNDKEKLKREIASLSGFQARFVLQLVTEGRTLRDALRIIQSYFQTPKAGPSEIKEA